MKSLIYLLSIINYLLVCMLHHTRNIHFINVDFPDTWWHYVKKNLLKQLLNWVELVTWHVRKRSASNTWGSEDDVIQPPPPQIREDAICSGVVESHGAGCWAREASKMTAAPTAISTCGEQQQSAWQLSADRWDDGFPGPGPVHTAHCLAPSVLSLLWSQEPTSEPLILTARHLN